MKLFSTILALTLATVLAATGCSSEKVKKSETQTTTHVDYAAERERLEKSNEIVPGFTLDIKHSADAEISGEYQVDFNGQLKLPYKVTIKAAGLTPEELQKKITTAYSSYFKAANKVTVDITKRDYFVEARGLVQKPGRYLVRIDSSLEEIVALAGGYPGTGADAKAGTSPKPEYVRIVRPNFKDPRKGPSVVFIRLDDYFVKYEAQNELLWKGGEQLFFQLTGDPDAALGKSHLVQIMGEVRNPGEYPIVDGADLYTYIARSGGPTSTADLTSVSIIHRSDQSSTVVDLTEKGRIENLGPGDIVLVKSTQAKASTFERTLPILLAITSIATSVFLILFAL